MKCFPCAAAFALILVSRSLAIDSEPPTKLVSPDGRFTVKLEPNASDTNLMSLLDHEKVIAEVPTYGYMLSAFWSEDGRYLAINNRRANSGDYLWVFSLPDGKCIKQPDDIVGESFRSGATKYFGAINPAAKESSRIRDTLVATGWKERHDLKIQVFAEYTLRKNSAYTGFKYTAAIHVIDSTFAFAESDAEQVK
jgi:hypothetical protein